MDFTGICMLGLVAVAYVMIEGFINISENLEVGADKMLEIQKQETENLQRIENLKKGITIPQDTKLGAG